MGQIGHYANLRTLLCHLNTKVDFDTTEIISNRLFSAVYLKRSPVDGVILTQFYIIFLFNKSHFSIGIFALDSQNVVLCYFPTYRSVCLHFRGSGEAAATH